MSVLLLFVAHPSTDAAELPPRSVLILDQSGGAAAGPFYSGIIAAFRSVINRDPGRQTTIYVEHLDLSRFSGLAYEDSLAGYIQTKYAGKPIGVVMVLGEGALRYALRIHHQVWPSTPVVFTMVESDRARNINLPPFVTGLTYQLKLADMVHVARIIVPQLSDITIVGDRLDESVPYRYFKDEISSIKVLGLKVSDLTGEKLRDVLPRLATLSQNNSIIYTASYSDGEGTFLSPLEVLRRIVKVANRPIVINVDSQIGEGGVGGFILSRVALGETAASLTERILDGEDVKLIPIMEAAVVKPVFDWRELQRWKIDEASLPPGSEIRFRQQSLWEEYKTWLITIVAAILLQAALIQWLLFERKGRLASESLARTTMQQLTQRDRLATGDEVSGSIAHEVLQPITGIVGSASAGLRWLSNEQPDLQKVRLMLNQIVTAGHRTAEIIRAVRAVFKQELKCDDAIQINELIKEVIDLVTLDLRRERIQVQYSFDENLPQISGDRVQLQQVFLNLIVNAIDSMKSVPAQHRTLRLCTQVVNSSISVSVEDTGPGLQSDKLEEIFRPMFTTKPHGMGLGLAICRSIIEAHGGKIWADSPGSRGLNLVFLLPTSSASSPES